MPQAARKEDVEAAGSSLSLIPENIDAVSLYTESGITGLISKVKEVALSEVRDVSTPSGRASIKSLAAKVARSKTLIDDAGESLIEDARKKVTSVNALRKLWRDEMDGLKAAVRAPVTEWENAETSRMAAHEAALIEIEQLGRNALDMWMNLDSAAMEANIQKIRGDNRDFEEFAPRRQIIAQQAISNLVMAIAKNKQHHKDQADLKRLQDEESTRKKKESDDRIAADAAAEATRKANERAARDIADANREARQAQEREGQALADLIDADIRAEKAAAQAEKDRKDAAELATRKERERIDREQKEAAEESAKREADKKHHAKINNEAVEAIKNAIAATDSVGDNVSVYAKAVVTAIAKGEVPNVKIFY